MYCWKCGKENADGAGICAACGARLEAVPEERRIEDDPGMRLLLPIGCSGLAIAAGYLGLFSVLLVPAPFAILFGVLALQDINRNPRKYGKGRAIFGIVIGVLCTVVFLAAFIISCLQQG